MNQNNNKSSSLKRLHFVAKLLDSQFTGPFGFKFGLDPILGLIPFFGDLLTTCISFYFVFEAYRMGCGFAIIFKCILNIVLEDVLKVLPFFGQIFDFYWKANEKNLKLLEEFQVNPTQTKRSIQWFWKLTILIILLFTLVTIVFFLWFSVTLLIYIYSWLQSLI